MLVLIANQVKVGPFVFTYVCQKSRKEFIDSRGRLNPARLAGERYSFTQGGWRRPWAAALKAAGYRRAALPRSAPHARDRILRQTGNLAIAKDALAHKSIKTTLRYAHASDDDVRRGLDASESRPITEGRAAAVKKSSNSADN
jgi:hypothetical protein